MHGARDEHSRELERMPVDSPKCLEAADRLPESLREIYLRFVEEYEFATFKRFGRGYVAYQVLADLVLAGWRPTAERHPDSPL